MPETDPTILDLAKKAVYGDREIDYGHPLDDFQRAATLISVVLNIHVKPEQIPLIMLCVKMSRAIQGVNMGTLKPLDDTLIDIAGYSETLSRVLQANHKPTLPLSLEKAAPRYVAEP